MRAEISCALYALPSMSIFQLVPMWRFTDRMVRSGLVIACRLATSPTSTSPVLENPTTDGVVLPPSALGITTGSPASSTLTTELVVPRSIPTALAMSPYLPPWSPAAAGTDCCCSRLAVRLRIPSVANLSVDVASFLTGFREGRKVSRRGEAAAGNGLVRASRRRARPGRSRRGMPTAAHGPPGQHGDDAHDQPGDPDDPRRPPPRPDGVPGQGDEENDGERHP